MRALSSESSGEMGALAARAPSHRSALTGGGGGGNNLINQALGGGGGFGGGNVGQIK